MQGKSLIPLIKDRHDQDEYYAILGGNEISIIRDKNYKLVCTNKKDYRLFDLAEDPEEKFNLSGRNQEALQSLKKELDIWFNNF